MSKFSENVHLGLIFKGNFMDCGSFGKMASGERLENGVKNNKQTNMATQPKATKNSPNDRRSNNVKQIFSTNHTV